MTLSDLIRFIKNLRKSKEKNAKLATLLLSLMTVIGLGAIIAGAALALINLNKYGVPSLGLCMVGFGAFIIIWVSITPVVKSWIESEKLRKKNEELEILLKVQEEAKKAGKILEQKIIDNILKLQEDIKKEESNILFWNRKN